jgi:ABC-2 type transport system permease protein
MTLLNVERIKLFTTRSPYWCLVAILLASVAFALIASLVQSGTAAIPVFALNGVGLSQDIFMIMAALAVTTEYRFNTMKTTFLAAPNRIKVLAAKTAVLAVIGLVVGEICAFGAFFLAKALAKQPPLPLELSGQTWRIVTGHGVLFVICAIIAVAVGSLLRQSAGAIAILLLWPLLVETLISAIPTVGKAGPWLPFQAGAKFVSDTRVYPGRAGNINGNDVINNGPSPVGGLLVFLGYAVILWVIAAVLLRRRDA